MCGSPCSEEQKESIVVGRYYGSTRELKEVDASQTSTGASLEVWRSLMPRAEHELFGRLPSVPSSLFT